jgi:DNA recombination protein RmuC
MTIVLIILACVLLVVILIVQVLQMRRQSRDAKGAGELLGAMTEVRGQLGQLSRDVSETRGRLAAVHDQQGAVTEAVTNLKAVVPLQLSEGLNKLDESASVRHTGFRGEVLAQQTKLSEILVQLQSAIPLQVGEAVQRLDEAASARDKAFSDDVVARAESYGRTAREQTELSGRQITELLAGIRTDLTASLTASAEGNDKRLQEIRTLMDAKLGELITRYSEGANRLNETAQKTTTTVTDRLAELKGSVDKVLKDELGAIRSENSAKLDEMRKTVDEKLHETLEKRLGDSFKIVSDRLEQVHRGLGEMQNLATGVGDLKKVLTNIKTRGTWGEVQLAALLDQILTPEQYGKNIECRPNSGSHVEFAIRLPGRGESEQLWLPIDAKFPLEDYQRMIEAQDRADPAAVEEAGKSLEARVKLEARNIRERYIDPPNTTDFAILYLATEGLYAEVLRRAGLADWCQRECKVNLASPTTLGALLNSLQMGFRTLAIEKHSSEVWAVLGAVKTEFTKFGEALAHTKKKLEQAHSSLESTEQRNRVLTRRLKGVDALPPSTTQQLIGEDLPLAVVGDDEDESPENEVQE